MNDCDRGCTPGYGHTRRCRAFYGSVNGIRYSAGKPDPVHVHETAAGLTIGRLRSARFHVPPQMLTAFAELERRRILREHGVFDAD